MLCDNAPPPPPRYRVRVHGSVPDWKLEAFRRGATVKGVRYKPMEASVEVGSAKKRAAAGAGKKWEKNFRETTRGRCDEEVPLTSLML